MRMGTELPAEQLVAMIATAMYCAGVISGTYVEPEACVVKAWDLYDSVFTEADERYKEGEDDAEPDGGSPRDTGPHQGR